MTYMGADSNPDSMDNINSDTLSMETAGYMVWLFLLPVFRKGNFAPSCREVRN